MQKVEGWKGRSANGSFAPRGVINHHTASAAGNLPCLGIVTHGRSDLPGPLCNFLLGRDGTVVIVAGGRANHAGAGGPTRGIPKDSGNAYTVGIEWENNGIGEPYPRRQLEAGIILNAVLLKRMKRGSYMAFEHREWTSRKIDRRIDAALFRKLVGKKLKTL